MNYSEFVNLQKLSDDAREDRCFIKRIHELDEQHNQIARLFSGAIGAASESCELLEIISPAYSKDNIVDELGDVLFYVTCSAWALDIDFNVLFNYDNYYDLFSQEYGNLEIKESAIKLSVFTGKYLDVVKKVLFQGKSLDEININKLKNILKTISNFILLCCDIIDVPFEYVYAVNMDKLNARYKNNFSVQESENKTKYYI